MNASTIKAHLLVQHELLFENDNTVAEIIAVAGPGGFLASQFWILFPFARGCVHISEDRDKPLIDPKFYTLDFDLDLSILVGRLAQKFWNSNPVSEYVQGQIMPEADVLPSNATNRQWEAFLRTSRK